MVRRVLGFMYKEVRGLHQAAYVLALFAFGSQLLALVRDRLLASQFGAGVELDIYYAAFRIPDILYVLFASTLSVYVLIPFIAKHQSANESAKAQALLSQVCTLFFVLYSVLGLLIFVAAPYITPWLFPGITDQTTLVLVLRILLLQPLLLGLSSLFGVVTQMGHRFVLYAISPLIYNVGIIFAVVVLYPVYGLSGLAMGVVLGAFGHMAIQWPLVRNSSLSFGITTKFDWSAIKSVLTVSIPRAITLSLNQIVLLVLVGIASGMTVGSVSVFQFAFNLQSVPLAVIGVSYSVAAFPMLAELYAGQNMERFRLQIVTALRHIIFWSIPIIALCVVLRAQMVRVILGSGAFNWEDTRLTAAVFAILIVSLVSHGINLLLIRAFYAGGDTRTPLIVSVFTTITAIAAAIGFTRWYETHDVFAASVATMLRVGGVAGTEVLTLAAAYMCAVVLQSVLLIWFANRSFGLVLSSLWVQVRHACIAAAIGGLASYAALQFFVDGLNTETFIGIFLQGSLAGLFGVCGVVLGYLVCASPELKEVASSVERKIFKTDVIAPEEDVL